MFGGLNMNYKYKSTPSIIKLSGETGKEIFNAIIKDKSKGFDAKKASKMAHKELRKQGFYM